MRTIGWLMVVGGFAVALSANGATRAGEAQSALALTIVAAWLVFVGAWAAYYGERA